MRQFKKTKRILTREEQITMHESAKASAERDRHNTAEYAEKGYLLAFIAHIYMNSLNKV